MAAAASAAGLTSNSTGTAQSNMPAGNTLCRTGGNG